MQRLKTISDMSPLQRLNHAFYGFATAGFKGTHSSKQIRHIFLSTMFGLIAFCLLLIFSIEALIIGDRFRGIILSCFILFTIVNYLILRKTGRYELTNNLTVFMMAILCFYLICTGGVDRTGPLWYFTFPVLALYIQGLRNGMISMVIFLLVSSVFLFVPGIPFVTAEYSIFFKTRLLGALGGVTFISFIYEYSRERAQKELLLLTQQLETTARTDELTGLANRRVMNERLVEEVHRVGRGGRGFTVILCDIDHFKHVNDTYGHQCGDYVLKTVAGLLNDTLRRLDTISRWGGEEFLVLLPETEREGGACVADVMKEAVELYDYEFHGQEFTITMSFGVHASGNLPEPERLIRIADENLYRAKAEGRNRVICS